MRYITIFLSLFILGEFLFTEREAAAFSATGNATVIIDQQAVITPVTAMNFGRVYSNNAAGTVTLSPAGIVSSGTHSYDLIGVAGVFSISADPNTPLTITFSNGTLISGGNTIALHTFTHTSEPASDTTNPSGTLVVNVGGTIDIAADQASGDYNGTYTINVSY